MPAPRDSIPYIHTALHPGPVSVVALPHDAAAGAEAIFVGRTRGETHPAHPAHGPLQHLDYHTYPAMAQTQLRQLAERVAADHGLLGIRIVHATGPVAVGEASVVVQCNAAHRDAAFAACRDAIDTLKATLPIWKREVWADGTTFQDGQPVSVEAPRAEAQTNAAESPT